MYVQVSVLIVDLQESNVRLKLTVVDSVGFADQINKENSVVPIVEYIDKQYEAYLQVSQFTLYSIYCTHKF